MGSKKKILSKYFIHEHTLELNDYKAEDNIGDDCIVCGESISNGQYYRCSVCPSTLIHHYPCSEIQFQIDQHPFHPPHRTLLFSQKGYPNLCCDACGRCCSFGTYKCGDCDFVLDVKCALLTNNNSHHHHQPNHFHPLISCKNKYKIFSYTCCYCDLRIDGDWVYACLECKGFLDHSCAELPWKIEHPFHSFHPLVLLHRQTSDWQLHRCSVCSGEQAIYFAYHCLDCGFVSDFHCAGLKPEQAQTQIQIQQFTHSHPLVVCKNFGKFPFRRCYACRLSLSDSIYFCPECCVLLHESCADLPPEINHLLHPNHTLTLRNNPPSPITFSCRQQCGACLSYLGGIFYECSDCEWYMDVRCAFLSKPTLMRSKIHRHPLALVCGEDNARVYCYTCSNLCLSRIPFFRCVWCNVNQHVHCISALPPTLKYNNHVHPLTLTYCPIKDRPDEDDNAEFYCDACEERRDLALPTYYCKDGCQFVAHPHCVVSEIIHSLEEEWSKHGKVEELRALTLKEFLDSFTEDENKEVQGLFKAYKRSVQGEKGKILLCLYQDEDEDEDEDNKTDMIKVLMKKFVSGVTLPWENWDSTSKVIEDGNNMILEDRVSILEVLLSKFGDFSKSSRLGTKATMLFTMTVCEAVHDICSTRIGEITTSQLLIWLHSFALAQYAGFEIQFVIARLTELVRTHFGRQADYDIPVDLELAKMGVPIATQLAVVDSKELTNIEQDGETDDDLWKKISWQLTIMKLDETIEDLKKKKQALLKMQEVRCLRNECLGDVLGIMGQMAGASLL